MSRRDGMVCLSLASLVRTRTWAWILSNRFAYHADSFHEVLVIWAARVIEVVALAVLLTICLAAVRKLAGHRCDRVLGSLACALILSSNRLPVFEDRLELRFGAVGLAAYCGAILLAILAPLMPQFQLRWIKAAALIMLPLIFINLGMMIYRVFSWHGSFGEKAGAAMPSEAAPRRVVWIIFDELDERLTFRERPPGLTLPEFDRLRSQSVFSDHAFPPPGLATERALPALLTGRYVADFEPAGPNQLRVRVAGERATRPWDDSGTVFTDAARLASPSAVVGFFNPYCRTISEPVSCYSAPIGDLITVGSAVRSDALAISEEALQVGRHFGFTSAILARMGREYSLDRHRMITPKALQAIADKRYALVFIHLPIPHPPGIYDSVSRQLTTDVQSGYLENLELTDHTLAMLRQSMEDNGTWDRTTLIISGDHGLRGKSYRLLPGWTARDEAVYADRLDHRVVFLVKMPGQTSPIGLDAEFNTILTRQFVKAVLHGDLQTGEDAERWFKANRVPPGPEALEQPAAVTTSSTHP